MKYFAIVSIYILTICSAQASESSVYDFSWLDSDKEVYVLQNRKFRKVSRFYFGGQIGTQINGAFVDSFQYQLHAGYFFTENWGVEFGYLGADGSTNDTHDAVNEQGSAVAFYRKIESEMRALLVWSPFYAKINTFNKIFYYDWVFGLGVSSVTTQDNRNEFDIASTDSGTLTEETNTGLAWMTAFRFYITEHWSSEIRFSATHLNVDMVSEDAGGADSSDTRLVNYYNINFGVNYTF